MTRGERLALDRYRQSGDGDDAVAVARETLGVEGDDALTGGEGEDEVAGDGEPSKNRGQDLRDATQATVTPESLDRAVEDIEAAQARAQSGEPAFQTEGTTDVRIGDNRLDPETAALLGEALSLQPGEVDDFIERLGPLRISGQLTGQQVTALIEVARRSGDGGFLDPSLSQSGKRSRSGALLRALDKRMVDRQRFSESMQQVVEGGALRNPRARPAQLAAIGGDRPPGGPAPNGPPGQRPGADRTDPNAGPGQTENRGAEAASSPIEPIEPSQVPRKSITGLGGSRPPMGGRQTIPPADQIEWLDAPGTGALRGHAGKHGKKLGVAQGAEAYRQQAVDNMTFGAEFTKKRPRFHGGRRAFVDRKYYLSPVSKDASDPQNDVFLMTVSTPGNKKVFSHYSLDRKSLRAAGITLVDQ